MKKTVISIGKSIMIYMIAMIVINAICVLIVKSQRMGESYLQAVSLILDNNDNANNVMINFILSLKQVLEGILLAILASYIFANMLNKEARIIFPDKIVIRRRTSEGSMGKLTFGVLIGNPGKRWLYDVKCSVNCTYFKSGGEIAQRNSETYLSHNIEFIQNYYRFSFDINSLPKSFWKHYLERKEAYIDNDFLLVTISGKINGLGGYFRVNRKYHLQDIIIDTHEPEKNFKKKVRNIFTWKEKTKIDWKVFPVCIEAGEDERQNIIDEIRIYVNSN